MPNTINLYEPRSMTQALLEAMPVRRFLTSTFFGEEIHDTKSFDIDIWKGSRRLAPVVHPKMAGKVVDRESFRTLTFTPPYLKPKKVTEADHVLNRLPGETIYTTPGSNTPAERAAVLLGKDLAELEESIQRRVEAMAADALFTGVVHVKGDGVDVTVDYDFDPSHLPVLTGADLWTAATSKILENLKTWKRLVSKDSGATATDVILGQDAASAFLANKELVAMLNTLNLSVGNINPADMGEGVTYMGRLTAVGLDIWSYDEWYVDEETQLEVPMVPVDRCLVIARNIRATVHYGVIQDINAQQFATRSFAKSWTVDDPAARYVMVQSAPLPVVHQVNALVSAVVVE